MDKKTVCEYQMGELVGCAGDTYGLVVGRAGENTYHIYMREYGGEVQRYKVARLKKVRALSEAEKEVQKELMAEYKMKEIEKLKEKRV